MVSEGQEKAAWEAACRQVEQYGNGRASKELAKRWTEAEELFVMKMSTPRLDLRVTCLATDTRRRMTDVLPDL